jgi:drug/metabolite transporter (DMT)-like permease
LTGDGRRPLAGAVLVLAAAALWATFGPFAKALYARGYTPIELASIRAWIGWLGIAVVAARTPARLRMAPRDLPLFLLYGVVGFAIFEYLYFLAMERTTVAIAVALLYTAPAFVALLSRVLWREPITGAKLAALAAALCGVMLVTGALRSLAAGDARLTPVAAVIGLGAGFAYALYTIFSKVALGRYDALGALFWSFGFAAVFLALLAPPLGPVLRAPAAFPLLLGLGLLPTLLAYLLYLIGLHRLRPTTASMLACVEPVIATLLAGVLLGERIAAEQVLGMSLIVGAAGWFARAAR